MEKILESISNPYSMENYKKLFNIFLNSKDYGDFYAKVVTYFKDGFKEGDVEEINIHSKFTRTEYMGIWHVMKKFSEFFPTEHRIYINAPIDKVGIIVSKFISECDLKKLPFELKYAIEQVERNDSIVIGSNTAVYRKHIGILRQIVEENPEIAESCGTPPLLTGVLDGWLGLADENVSNRYISYTQSRLQAFTLSVNKFLYKHQDIASQIGAKEILDIDSILELYDYMDDEEKKEYLHDFLSEINLSVESKNKLREYIKENSGYLKEIYEIFYKECEKRDFDSKYPLFYNGSRKQLLENEKSRKVDLTDEVRNKMSNNSATIIADMYFKEGIREKLSVESRVEITENIIDKEVRDRKEELLMHEDLDFLHKIGFISDELMAEINQNLYPKEKLRAIDEYIENQVSSKYNYSNDKKTLSRSIKNDGKLLSEDEIKKKISERKNEIIEYFTRPQILSEKKEQRIEAEEMLLKKYLQDRTFPYMTKCAFRAEIDLLKSDIEQLSKKRETRRKICIELHDKEVEDTHIKKVREIIRPSKTSWDDFDL